jgi:hypothetical protein
LLVKGEWFSKGERVETRTLLCRGVEGQILSVSDIAMLQQLRGAIIPDSAKVEVMHSLLVVSLVAFAFVAGPPIAVAQDSCDKQFVVSDVSLPTTTQLSPSEQAAIRARLIGGCFDDHQLGELAGRVRDTLQNFGYFRATVSEPTMTIADLSRHPQPVSLNVEVVEGARYRVGQIQWTGVTAVSPEQIRSISLIHVEDILDMSKVRETLEAVRRLYAAIGYPKASIQVQVHDAGHRVSVNFRVVEGAQSP